MIEVHQLVSIFCQIDDFCKQLDNYSKHKTLPAPIQSRTGPPCSLDDSEIMTLLILFQMTRFRDFKTFYSFVKQFWLMYFPKMPSYQRFIELIKRVIFPMTLFVQIKQGKHSGIYYIDSSCLPVCHIKRSKNHKTFEEVAKYGKTSVGWFFGLKLQDIDDVGGIKKGIIFEFLPTSIPTPQDFIAHNGYNVFVGDSVGLGEYTHIWFMSNRSPYFNGHQEFHTKVDVQYSAGVDAMLGKLEQGDSVAAAALKRRLHAKSRRAGVVVERLDSGGYDYSDTGSQSDDDKAAVRRALGTIDKKTDVLKQLEGIMNKHYPGEEANNHQFLSGLRSETLSSELVKGTVDSLCEDVEKKFDGAAAPNRVEVEGFIKETLKPLQSAFEQSEEERIKQAAELEAEKQKAEEFERQMQVAELRADSEARARQAAEQKTEEFKQKIREMEQQLADKGPQPPEDPADSASQRAGLSRRFQSAGASYAAQQSSNSGDSSASYTPQQDQKSADNASVLRQDSVDMQDDKSASAKDRDKPDIVPANEFSGLVNS